MKVSAGPLLLPESGSLQCTGSDEIFYGFYRPSGEDSNKKVPDESWDSVAQTVRQVKSYGGIMDLLEKSHVERGQVLIVTKGRVLYLHRKHIQFNMNEIISLKITFEALRQKQLTLLCFLRRNKTVAF